MTKADLIEAVINQAMVNKKDAETIVNIFIQSIIESLNRGEGVELRGFGSFRIRERGGRLGRNPRTGDRVEVSPKKVPYFKAGKELKQLINPNE
jgi:integration host factor subunit beta